MCMPTFSFFSKSLYFFKVSSIAAISGESGSRYDEVCFKRLERSRWVRHRKKRSEYAEKEGDGMKK